MKKILLILFLLVTTTLFSQGGFPVNSTVGSPKSTVLTKGVSAADSGYQYRTNFQDTGSANNGELKNVPGVVIRVRSDLWMRDEYALSWIKIGSNASVIDTTSLSDRINAKADSGLVWKNIGNYGTNPITNYIGTNDAHGFSIRVNGSRAGFIGHANMTSVFGGDVILGQFAGEAQDTLHKKNTIIGHAAMRYNTVANQSVAVGNWAGHHTIGSGDASGARFVYVGQSSGFYNLYGYSNTGVGTFTLERQFNGAGNSAWGRDALRTNNDGDYNTAGGILSMAYAASGVDSIIVTSGGSGYTSATITISSPFTGSTTAGTCWGVATATAVISGGAIVGITVNDPGCGYSIAGGVSGGGVTIPAGATVTITGDGAGASATAVIGAPRYTTSIGTTSGLYARMPLGGLYLGYNAGSNLRYRDKYVTLIGTNTSVSSSLSLYTNVSKSIALGYGATVSRSNILEIGANGADGVGVNLRYNKNYGSASLDSIGLLNVYDSLGNNMLYIKSWRPYSGSTIVAGYTSNIIFGDSAAYKNPYNWNSVVIGGQAMRNTPYNGNTVQTTVTGSFGLYSLQGGTGNTGIGEKVLYSLLGNATSPVPTSWNTAIGQRAAYYLVSGRDNFAGGQNSMSGIISGDYNTATGSNSLGGSGVDTTSNASAYGIRALYGSGRRDNSSAFGYQAGFNTVGTGNLFLGYNAGASLGTVNNRLYIHNTSGTPLIYGEFDTYKVQINGDFTVTDTLTGVTLDNADSSHRMATTAWVKRQGYGGGGGGGTMVYPGAGIPLSTGSAWGTSITDNSGNWNAAYSWGDHAGLYPTVSRFTDSLLAHTGRFNGVTSALAGKLNITDTTTKTWDWADITGKPNIILVSDSSSMLNPYTRVQRFLDSLANHTIRFNGVTSSLALKFNISDTASKTWDWGDVTGKPSVTTWDGGSTGLTASTGRTSLGGTTVGQNIFTLPNPSSKGWIRTNADNSVSVLDSAAMRLALGITSGGVSDGYVSSADFDPVTNLVTLTQVGASDVIFRIDPSYIVNPVHPDSLVVERNDSTAIVKAVSIESDHPDISVTTIRNDSVNRHVISKVYVEEPIATFSAGAGFAIDTTMFTDSTIYGSFFTGQDSFYITRAVAVIKGQSGDTLGIQIIHNDTINLTGTIINGGTMAINSRTSGNIIDVSTNQGVPPGTWIWMKSPTVIAGKRPEYLSVTLIGYRKYQAP